LQIFLQTQSKGNTHMRLQKQLLHRLKEECLSADEQAQLRCEIAKQYEDYGNYDAAREVMSQFWANVGMEPKTQGLSTLSSALIVLRAGALTGHIGSSKQLDGAQEIAKDLIGRSMSTFSSENDEQKLAEAQIELAVCYWREGSFDEARVILQDALIKISECNDDLKALALLRKAVVEGSAKRLNDALRTYNEAAPLFERSTNLAQKGKFHHGFGFVLRNLGGSEERPDYIDRSLIECSAASYYFEQAGLLRYQACVENNLGFLFGTLQKFAEAHEHLDRAQMLLTRLKDDVHLAQVDETRARVMLAEGRVVEAEKTVRASVRTLEKGDEQSLLAEALTTHGIAQARLQHPEQARETLQRALEVAQRAGDLESAGNAALVLVEELAAYIPNDDLKSTIDLARELLENTQDLSALKRLANCSALVLTQVHASPRFPGKVDWATFSFRTRLLEYEAHFIKLALEDAGGVVSRAARLLGFNHHQSLLSMLNGRHEILRHRETPILPRRRSIIRQPGENGTRAGKRRSKRKTRILLAESDPELSSVRENLEQLGFEVEQCNDGTTAMERIAGGKNYHLLLLNNEIPGVSGCQLARLARSLTHHRRTPIIILSENSDVEQSTLSDPVLFSCQRDDMESITGTINQLFHRDSH
jgi:CheY-like chemotaxis protein/tetratricopeptide (TPR) repeat protein